jgi:phospholipase/carboxylesterase
MRRSFLARQFESVWVPASSRVAPDRQKLMIFLHGRGDSLEAFRDIRNEMEMPEMNYLLLNAPASFEDGFSWYDLKPRHRPGVRHARAKLFALVRDLVKDGWRPREIFFLGHSQGALMACDLLLNHSLSFGGVVGVSGYVWFFRGWQEKVRRSGVMRTPWLMTYGVRDRVIPPAEIRDDLRRLQEAGIPVAARAFGKGHDFDFEFEVPFVRSWLRLQIDASRKTRQVPRARVEISPLIQSYRRRKISDVPRFPML